MNGRILGQAGGGLTNATWAANADVARVGAAGERRTAELLNRFASHADGVTVMHDLHIPQPGFTANIDHLVVSGQTVHIIDAKVWKPARYWTLGGKTRRGWKRFPHADKQTMGMARDALGRYLTGRGIAANFAEPVVVVWPSSSRASLNVRWLRVPGARTMTGDAFVRYADKTFAPSRLLGRGSGSTADPNIVAALANLLVNKTSSRPARGTGTSDFDF